MSAYISPLMWLCLFVTLLPVPARVVPVQLVACCMGIALAVLALIQHY